MATDFVQQPEADGPPRVPEDHVVRSTRTSRIWTVAILSALILIFLLIFIVENGQRVTVSFLGIDGHLPLGVALLFAAIAGALLLAIPGVGRIFQLRRVARHHRATEAEPPSVR
ncbi:lipopolysaccharide assembly protein LapA domain-containing protein [Frankia sp. Cj3]|uniref:lipopolysaccharide assembly protein LapA domain-containing protein n=1 Tax=Frankia sp. Cj3 TaxID=2880976 RepID=UPI001EF48F02|nr:lipopolysaccharide assembly protein LapA domain-containing protein [Frankia sp. Cj3]